MNKVDWQPFIVRVQAELPRCLPWVEANREQIMNWMKQPIPSKYIVGGKPVWEYSSQQYRNKIGAPVPMLGEISPTQYASLSKRGKRIYDAKKQAEWERTGKGHRSWRDLIIAAYDEGYIDPHDPKLKVSSGIFDNSPSDVIWGAIISRKKEDRDKALGRLQKLNRAVADNLETGNICYAIGLSRYGEVTKKFKVSARLRFKDMESTIKMRALAWLHYNQLVEAMEQGVTTVIGLKAFAVKHAIKIGLLK